MALASVYESAHKGDFDQVKSKLDETPTLLTTPDPNQRILLHWASLGGNYKLVTYLIELGSPIDFLDETNTTPLILASSAGHYETVSLLLKKGANANQQSTYGHSSMQYAASKNWLQVCIKLADYNADINIVDARGSTPLHRAASKGNLEVVNFLVSFNHLNINARDVYGNTALHLACEEDRQDECLVLVGHGADVEITNKQGKTPMDMCSLQLMRIIKSKMEANAGQ